MDDHPKALSELSLYQQLSEIRQRLEYLTAEETHVSRRLAGGVDGADLTLAQIKAALTVSSAGEARSGDLESASD